MIKSIESEGHTTVGQRSCTKTEREKEKEKKKKNDTKVHKSQRCIYDQLFLKGKKMKMNLLKKRERER